MEHAERLCNQLIIIARGRKLFDGDVSAAKRSIPRRAIVDTDDDLEPLLALSDVRSITPVDRDGTPLDEPGGTRWEIGLTDTADPQGILRACFERNIHLRSFDHREPSHHDVFVRLVGPGAREASYR